MGSLISMPHVIFAIHESDGAQLTPCWNRRITALSWPPQVTRRRAMCYFNELINEYRLRDRNYLGDEATWRAPIWRRVILDLEFRAMLACKGGTGPYHGCSLPPRPLFSLRNQPLASGFLFLFFLLFESR